MLSRVASNIYWMARYAERAENTARLINVATQLQLDLPRNLRPGWAPLLAITGGEDLFREQCLEPDEKTVVRFLIGDHRNPSSIIQSLKWARENARTVREFVPRDGWEQINELFRIASAEIYLGISSRGRYDYLRRIIRGVQAITGLLAGTMSHDEGYSFLKIGRNLERADMTTRIIDVLTADLLRRENDLEGYQGILWMSVLDSLSGTQMYRRQMQQAIGWVPVLTFLFKDRIFPRSFMHCTNEAAQSLGDLLNHQDPLAVAERLQEQVRELDPAQLGAEDLRRLIDDLQLRLGLLNSQIAVTYFNEPLTQESAQSGG